MLSDGAGSSDSADSVMRHLQGLKVRAREIRSRKEARCYAIRSKGQCRSVEHLFFTFSADVQHLHRREGLITQGCLRMEESTRGITIFSPCTLVTFLLLRKDMMTKGNPYQYATQGCQSLPILWRYFLTGFLLLREH